MATNTGTYDITSLLKATFQSAAEFGLDTIEKVLAADLVAHNTIMNDMVSELCDVTVDRQRIYGTSVGGDMQEVDEYGAAPTQRAAPGASVGFPLRLFQYNIGWTAKHLQVATPADLAIQTQAAEKAHIRGVLLQIKRAIYRNANYTFVDHLVDNVDLFVKRFNNADSAAIPDGPNGEVFDGASHDHYQAEASLTAPFLTDIINNVIEHGHGGAVKVAINKANEAAVRALTGFVAYVDPRLAFSSIVTTTGVPSQTLDIARLDNRAIGIFAGAEIWVKSWAITNYPFVWDSADVNKPLAFRQRNQTSLQGLRIAAENADYPLYAKFMEAEFGVGVWTRTNGAVLKTDNITWSDPTIT